MIAPIPSPDERVLAFRLSDKLHDEDYKSFVPLVDDAIAKEGKIRMLVEFQDFHGWDAHALWDDTKFAMQHYSKIERVALVGETKWEQGMAIVCKPFTLAKVKYFDRSQLDDAWKWIAE